MKSAYQIIRRPVITEKGLAIKENQNTLVFQVAPKATKTEIKEAVQMILNETTKVTKSFITRKQGRYEDLLKGKIDVDFVARLERKNDSDTISDKSFDFSKTTVRHLIQNGYEESKQQLKEVLVME